MVITDLSNNFYFAKNDIWVDVSPSNGNALYMVVKYEAGSDAINLKAYPLDNAFKINISEVILALFSDIDLDNVNSFLKVKITFTIFKDNGTETDSVERYYIYGCKNRLEGKWYLESADTLYPSGCIGLKSATENINYISGNSLLEKSIDLPLQELLKGCDHVHVRFINSRGAKQYLTFDSYTLEHNSQITGYTKRISTTNRGEHYYPYGNDRSLTIELHNELLASQQRLFTELANSEIIELYWNGYIRVRRKEKQSAVYNNFKDVFENSIVLEV